VKIARPARPARPAGAPSPAKDTGVVGMDGSSGSRAAMEFAVAEAALRDVPLIAVCALCDAAGVFGEARSIKADFMTAMGKVAADHPEVFVQQLVEQGAPSFGVAGGRGSGSAARSRSARPAWLARDDAGFGQPRCAAPCDLPGDRRPRRLLTAALAARRGPRQRMSPAAGTRSPASLCRWSHRVLMIQAGAATGRLAGHGFGCRCSGQRR